MKTLQGAALYYKTMMVELSSASSIGTPGPGGGYARRRVAALIELFFLIGRELGLNEIVEVGAHNAEASLRFLSSDPEARALAYEASPEVYNRVKASGLPDRFNLVNSAVGTKIGSTTFFQPKDAGFALWGSTIKRRGFDDVNEISVPMTTLDKAAERLVNSLGRNVALWIDVEGCALDVLQSGRALLKERVGTIYVEVNDLNTYAGSASVIRLIELLLECDFVPLARDNEYHDAWNLVAVHGSYFDVPREGLTNWSYTELEATSAERGRAV